jgi:hypothetical protein
VTSTAYGVNRHPDLPRHLVHFTGRSLGIGPKPAAHKGTAEDRLKSILKDGRINAHSSYGSPPVVCICEVTTRAATALVSTGVTDRGPYAPWGVLLHRDEGVRRGARPVLHLSEAERDRLKADPAAPPMAWRVVLYEPPGSTGPMNANGASGSRCQRTELESTSPG